MPLYNYLEITARECGMSTTSFYWRLLGVNRQTPLYATVAVGHKITVCPICSTGHRPRIKEIVNAMVRAIGSLFDGQTARFIPVSRKLLTLPGYRRAAFLTCCTATVQRRVATAGGLFRGHIEELSGD